MKFLVALMAHPAVAAFIAVAVCVVLLGAVGWGYKQGYTEGTAKVQKAWDEEKAAQALAIENQRNIDLKAANDLRAEMEMKNRQLEKLNEESLGQLQAALKRKAICPKSGQIGDVVIDADLARGMWVYQNRSDAVPPARPAARTRAAVQRGGSTPN